MKLLTPDDIVILRARTVTLLTDVGLEVDHEEVQATLLAAGCSLTPDGRVRIPKPLLDELVALQESRRGTQAGSAPRPQGVSNADAGPAPQTSGVMPCAFSPGPTRYYDLDTGQTVPVDTAVFTNMMCFADATPEIARVAPWFRQDVPAATSSVENLVLALKLTRKTVGIDALNPAEVKYLVEVSEVVTGRPGDSSYVGGSQCMTPPLILGHRAAQEMLERKRYGVQRYYVATMAMVGTSAPVDLLSATALAAAEVLGGLAVAFVINPEAALTGTAATTVVDMATGNAAMNAPESALLDAAVSELFEAAFGGHVSPHVCYAPTVSVPGLQAVYENFFGALARARLLDETPTYPGNGNLGMGGIGSPVQAMLDIEILRSLHWLEGGLKTCQESFPFEELADITRRGGNFLATDHTMRNFRSVWSPRLFLRRGPGAEWDASERAILERCNAQWKENLSRYQPPAWDTDTLQALDAIVQRARAELL